MRNNYSDLKLRGATANAAVDCMRKDGVMPAKPAYDGAPHTTVEIAHGQVAVTEFDPTFPGSGPMSVFRPAEGGKPAEALTIEATAAGPSADVMRQKARACALKNAGAAP